MSDYCTYDEYLDIVLNNECRCSGCTPKDWEDLAYCDCEKCMYRYDWKIARFEKGQWKHLSSTGALDKVLNIWFGEVPLYNYYRGIKIDPETGREYDEFWFTNTELE